MAKRPAWRYDRPLLLALYDSPLVSKPSEMPTSDSWCTVKDDLISPLQAPQTLPSRPARIAAQRGDKIPSTNENQRSWDRVRSERGPGNAHPRTTTATASKAGAAQRTAKTERAPAWYTQGDLRDRENDAVEWDDPSGPRASSSASPWIPGNKATGNGAESDGMDSIQRFKQLMRQKEASQREPADAVTSSASVFDDLLHKSDKKADANVSTLSTSQAPGEGAKDVKDEGISSRFARFFDANRSGPTTPHGEDPPDATSAFNARMPPPASVAPSAPSAPVSATSGERDESMSRLLGMFQLASDKLKTKPAGHSPASPSPAISSATPQSPAQNPSPAPAAYSEPNALLSRLFDSASMARPAVPHAPTLHASQAHPPASTTWMSPTSTPPAPATLPSVFTHQHHVPHVLPPPLPHQAFFDPRQLPPPHLQPFAQNHNTVVSMPSWQPFMATQQPPWPPIPPHVLPQPSHSGHHVHQPLPPAHQSPAARPPESALWPSKSP